MSSEYREVRSKRGDRRANEALDRAGERDVGAEPAHDVAAVIEVPRLSERSNEVTGRHVDVLAHDVGIAFRDLRWQQALDEALAIVLRARVAAVRIDRLRRAIVLDDADLDQVERVPGGVVGRA